MGMKVCHIDRRSLKIMGQRYALHIMRNIILLKQNRFNQFLNSIEGNNSTPTEKGMAVQRILAEIASFSTKYEPEIIFVDRKPRNNMKALFGTRNLSGVYDF